MLFSIFFNLTSQTPPRPSHITAGINITPPPQTTCNNGGLEYNDFTNWQGYYGGNYSNDNGNIILNNLTYGFSSGSLNSFSSRQTIVTQGLDPFGNFNIVDEGIYSLRIGNAKAGAQTELAAYTFTVTNSNKDFSFRYAMVLQDPEHPASEQPFFQYMVLKGNDIFFTSASDVIASKVFKADKSNPFFNISPYNSGVVYRDWTTECIDLSNYVGQTVTIFFLTADCAQGGHFGYAYVDGLCNNSNKPNVFATINNTTFCLGDDIIINGSGSTKADSYFISIAQSTYNWSVIPGTEQGQWFVAQQPDLINITDLANSWGYNFQCNSYYRIKLAVTNQCGAWDEVVFLVYINCPDIDLGQDILMCCDNVSQVTIGDLLHNQHPLYTYSWASDPPGLITQTNAPTQTITPYISANYSVTVTDEYGCTITDDVNIVIEEPFEVTITVEKNGCCEYRLVPHVTFLTDNCKNGVTELNLEDTKWKMLKYQLLNYQWSDGYTGAEHTVSPTQNTTYSLTVSNSCQTVTTTVNVSPKSGPFPTLIAPNTLITTSNIPENRVMKIREFGSNAPLDGQPAYNATAYNLVIYDRWGQVIRDTSYENCEILQGEILWDGKNDNGNLVPTGVYVWKLYLKNCNHNDWTPVCNNFGGNVSSTGLCNEYCWNWWPPGYECCNEWTDPCAYRITVLH